MASLEDIRASLGDAHKDTRLNLGAVLEGGSLNVEQRWMVALTSAYTARNDRLKDAILEEVRKAVPNPDPVIEDARAAASLMAMNNVYYRFRHMSGKEAYSQKRAGLRMNRLAQVATNKVDFELASLAASAITGCETCVRAHEDVVTKGGLTEDQVHDAVRIAAVIHAAAMALES